MSVFGEIFFDDFVVGRPYTFGPYRVARQELLEFNQRWDPLPIHLDEAAARAQGHRGITASGQYTLCIKQLFLNQAPWCAAVIGALGFDEVRFPHPVYIDDDLSGTVVCTNTRASRSKPDCGEREAMIEFSGGVAVVTGAASVIGLGMARAFARKGMRLVVADIESDALALAADGLRADGAEVIAERVDVSDAAALERLADVAYERFGQVTVLCNNAGVIENNLPTWEYSLADWDWGST